MAKYSQKQKEYARKWDAAHLYRCGVAFPIEYKEILTREAEKRGVAVARMIRDMVDRELDLATPS